MALTAVVGLYAWYQDMTLVPPNVQMNITYICLWGAASLFQGVMTCISSLLPAITGVLSLPGVQFQGFDVWSLVLLISVPVVYFLAAAFAWHLYNDYAEDHGKKAYAFDPFGKYAAKYDPLEKDKAAERLFTSEGGPIFQGGDYGAAVSQVSDCLMSIQYLKEKFIGKASDHVALLTAWGPKAIGDSEGEFGEVAALMRLSLKAPAQSLLGKFLATFRRTRPTSSSKSAATVKAIMSAAAHGSVPLASLPSYQVVYSVNFFAALRRTGLLEVTVHRPLCSSSVEVERGTVVEVLRMLLATPGSSAMFKSLVKKALDGGAAMDFGAVLLLETLVFHQVSGLNKVRLDGVSVRRAQKFPRRNLLPKLNKTRRMKNSELLRSCMKLHRTLEAKASLVELGSRFDTSVGDTAEMVKTALDEAQKTFSIGRDPADTRLQILLRDGKTEKLEVKTEEPADGFREWWEKTILATPRDGSLQLRTNQSLGHCIYAPSISRAVEIGTQEDASNVYCVGVSEETSAPSARAGTTGAKLPESAFGGMKSYTYAVAGDHDGVGTVQTLFDNTKRRGPNYRDQGLALYQLYAVYMGCRQSESKTFPSHEHEQSSSIFLCNAYCCELCKTDMPSSIKWHNANDGAAACEIFAAFQPELTAPYGGQSLVTWLVQGDYVPSWVPAGFKMADLCEDPDHSKPRLFMATSIVGKRLLIHYVDFGISDIYRLLKMLSKHMQMRQLVTLQALKPSRKQLLIPRGVGLPEDIVKMAALCAMSPLRGPYVDLHLLSAAQAGNLRVTDPLKSFLKVVERHLSWRVHYHEDVETFVRALHASEYPPYFQCIKDKHLLPLEVLKAVAEQGGYLYEGLPNDPFSLFRCLTATQAWTVSCTEAQVAEARFVCLFV
ncbi:unnamed protein product [Symbiodinium natans]|uniref:Uncharacterized protein n=1 Tax=Symbiodinium natans TaxID=878477 RepID=A0A812Q3U6_9DINO|nr:unnamed protein product [Symbiodinium natans]